MVNNYIALVLLLKTIQLEAKTLFLEYFIATSLAWRTWQDARSTRTSLIVVTLTLNETKDKP